MHNIFPDRVLSVPCMADHDQPTPTDDESEGEIDFEAMRYATLEDTIQQDPLVETFGDHPRARILSALIRAAAPLTPARIVEVANIGRRTWYDHVDALLDTGLVREIDADEIDGVLPIPSDATLYQLTDDERATALVDFYERYQIGQHDHLRAPSDQSDDEN